MKNNIKAKKVKVRFEILDVNLNRKMRTDNFIKVNVYEDDVLDGWYWQSPKLIQSNLERFGADSYTNKEQYEKLFREIEAMK